MLPRGVASLEFLELSALLEGCRRTSDTRPGGPGGGAIPWGVPERLAVVPVVAGWLGTLPTAGQG